MTKLFFVAPFLLATAVASVSTAQSVPQWSDSLKGSGRRAAPFSLLQSWSRSGSISDTVLLQPGAMLADSATLWIVDYSPSRIVKLDARNGAISRVIGRIGKGPGEWIGPLSLAGRRQDEIGVYDSGMRRISWISIQSSKLRQETFSAVAIATHLCVLNNQSLLAAFITRTNSTQIARVSSLSNPQVSISELAWPALRKAPHVASQVRMKSTADGCLAYPLYGSGVARYDKIGNLSDTVALIETVPVATVDERQVSQGRSFSLSKSAVYGMIAATHVGDYLVVAFGGRSPQRRRLLDFYDWTTKRYVGSFKTSMDVEDISGSSTSLFVQMLDEEGFYRLQALRILGGSRRGQTY